MPDTFDRRRDNCPPCRCDDRRDNRWDRHDHSHDRWDRRNDRHDNRWDRHDRNDNWPWR